MGKNPYAGQALDRLIEADSGLTTDHLNMLASVTAGTATASKVLVLDADKAIGTITTATITNATIGALTYATASRTATADGLTTGTIAAAGMIQFVTVTSSDANHIIVLPAPTPGTIVILINGATGYEVRSSAPTTVLINGGTGGAAVESAIAASTMAIFICKTATAWAAFSLAGTTLAAVEAAA